MSQFKLDFSFGAREEDELSIAASESGLVQSEADDSAGAAPLGASLNSEANTEIFGQLTASGLSRLLHPAPDALGWMIGSWVPSGTHSLPPPQFFSSWKCMKS